MKRIQILITVLFLTACAAPITAPPTAVPSDTPPPPTSTSTVTPPPTITPSPTSSPTATEITPTQIPELVKLDLPPSPPYEETMLGYDLLSNGTDETCELPCWFGLRPGETTLSDLEDFFNIQLGYQSLSFASSPDPITFDLIASTWSFNNNYNSIHISTRVSRETKLLSRYEVSWNDRRFSQHARLYHFVRRLGHPSSVKIEMCESYVNSLELIAYFDAGLELTLHYWIDVEEDGSFWLCIDETDSFVSFGVPEQDYFETFRQTLVSFEDVFSTSLDSLDLSQPGVCLTGKFEPTSSDFE